MSDSELLGLRQPKYRGTNRWPKPCSRSTTRMPRNCPGWSRNGCRGWSNKLSWCDELETLTPFYWRSIRMLDTTARISCGSAPAIRALSMWTGSWSHHRRAGEAARAGSIAICSSMRLMPDTSALSVKSTAALQTRHRMLSMQRWDSSRPARQASVMAAGRSGICCTRCPRHRQSQRLADPDGPLPLSLHVDLETEVDFRGRHSATQAPIFRRGLVEWRDTERSQIANDGLVRRSFGAHRSPGKHRDFDKRKLLADAALAAAADAT
jgi:hypothetical protein